MDKFRTTTEKVFVNPSPPLPIPSNAQTQSNRTLDFNLNLGKDVVLYDFGKAYLYMKGVIGSKTDWSAAQDKTYPRLFSATYVDKISLYLGGTPVCVTENAGEVARLNNSLYGSDTYRNTVGQLEINAKNVLDEEGDNNNNVYNKNHFLSGFMIKLRHFPIFRELYNGQKFIGNTNFRLVVKLKSNDDEILQTDDDTQAGTAACYFKDAQLVIPMVTFTDPAYYTEYVSANLTGQVTIPFISFATVIQGSTEETKATFPISLQQKNIRQIYVAFYNTPQDNKKFALGRYYSNVAEIGNSKAKISKIALEATPGKIIPVDGYRYDQMAQAYDDLMINQGYDSIMELKPISYNTWLKKDFIVGFDLRGMYAKDSFSMPSLRVEYDKNPNAGSTKQPVIVFIYIEFRNALTMTNYDGNFSFKTDS